MIYRLLADTVLLLHAAYVLTVVFGLAAIVAGLVKGKAWARNRYLRWGHLAMIGIVVVQAWLGVVCPLTRLENGLRRLGGQEAYPLDFLEYWGHYLMFFSASRAVFITIYTAFILVVIATFVLAPPRRRELEATAA